MKEPCKEKQFVMVWKTDFSKGSQPGLYVIQIIFGKQIAWS